MGIPLSARQDTYCRQYTQKHGLFFILNTSSFLTEKPSHCLHVASNSQRYSQILSVITVVYCISLRSISILYSQLRLSVLSGLAFPMSVTSSAHLIPLDLRSPYCLMLAQTDAVNSELICTRQRHSCACASCRTTPRTRMGGVDASSESNRGRPPSP
jgi:hypothetical protein